MKHLNKFSYLLLTLILSIFFIGCSNFEISIQNDGGQSTITNNQTSKTNASTLKDMTVNYIDVGQGDSILIQVNDKNMLIDAGPRSSQENLLKYLKDKGIKKLDYVVATHPHEDHIGGMGQVIKTFDIGTFLAPKVTTNTKTFEYMMNQLKNKNLKVTTIKSGMGSSIDLGENTKVEVFSPIKDINSKDKNINLNNCSPIIKITYGDTSFLFTGDAETEVEKEVLTSNSDVKATVLKLGHHGSSTSTCEEFFNKVDPEIAVMSLGKDNKYGHPHKETLSLLKKSGIKYYRTDEDSSVTIVSNGKKVTKK